MSRIGKLPIEIPNGVTITVDNSNANVTGPKGSLSQFMMPGINVRQEENKIFVERSSDSREHRSKHGLMRSLISNMIVGVTEGFTKQLEINGVGFRVSIDGNKLKLSVGYSHNINYQIPEDIKVEVKQNIITVSGNSKQKVGQAAAEIRAFKKPEPYKGKGIRYVNERIIRKSGKSGKEG